MRQWQYQNLWWRTPTIAFSPDGQEVLISGADGTVMWSVATGDVVRKLPGESAGFSLDGKLIVTAGAKVATIWDRPTGRPLKELKTGAEGATATFSPDGRRVAVAGDSGFVQVWDVATGQLIHDYRGDAENLVSAHMTRDGDFLVTVNDDGVDQLWELTTGKPTQRFLGPIAGELWVTRKDDGNYALHGRDVPLIRGETSTQPDYAPVPIANDFKIPARPAGAGHGYGPDVEDPDVFSLDGFERSKTALSSVATLHLPYHGGEYLTQNREGQVVLMRYSVDAPVRTFSDPSGRIASEDFSSDGSLVITASRNGMVRLWETATGKQLATLVSFEDGRWVVVDSEGRFDARDLDEGVPLNWVTDDDPMRALPLEIFMRDYYTPGLLARVLKGETFPDVRSIAEIRNRVQPEVKVVRVTPSATARRVDVVVHAANGTDKRVKSGVQDLRLFRDGQMVASGYVDVPAACDGQAKPRRATGGYIEGRLKDCDFTFHDVLLKSGAKRVAFTAYAFNSERIKSATATLDYEPKTSVEASAVKRHAYLLQVGVNHYAASGCELHDAVNDAVAMSAALTVRLERQGYMVAAVGLESLAGGSVDAASKQEIRKRLAEIAAKATPDDVFFMSFSGHGYSAEGGEFYILPSNAVGTCQYPSKEQLEAMLASAISADELAEWLRPIDAGEMTLVLDACHSAESVQAGGFKPGPMGSRGLGQVAYDKRIRVLAASQSTEVAHEYDYLGKGLLTYTLTDDGLDGKTADWKPKDGKITVGEWLAYAANAVPRFEQRAGSDAQKGVIPEGKDGKPLPASAGKKMNSPQVPALFDFSRIDSLVLQ